MRTYPINPKEVGRKGDLITIKDSDGRVHRIRGVNQYSSETVEYDLGDMVRRDDIATAYRPYQPGDWRAA